MFDIHKKTSLNKHRVDHVKKENLLNLLVGLWVAFMPIIIGNGFHANSVNVVSWNLTLTGICIIVLSYFSINSIKSWCVWLTFALGAWLMLSPYFLGYYENTGLLLNSLILGFIIMASSAELIPRSERPIYRRLVF